MKRIWIALSLLAAVYTGTQAQSGELDVYNYWLYDGDVSNRLYQRLGALAFEQLDVRKAFVTGLKTAEARRQYPDIAKSKVLKVMGAFPEKTPLNPVITGKLKRTDFTVEKLYFESRPNYYVTASLFIPMKGKGKKPAILYCCGHSAEGFRSEGYQRSILNLVKRGFVVLAFDPIGQGERIQYFDSEGNSVFSPTHEHSYPGSQLFVSGSSAANYFVWDGIRAIDYLVSRKEVDPQRIGITGRSGGGTQTAYIAAIDDRIVAAAPECYITSFEKLLRSRGPQDAEQNLIHSIAEGVDMSDFIEARAPKPTLMITTTSDIFSIQGARDVFKEATTIYEAFDKPENLVMVEDDAGHASTRKNREALCAFFQKHLHHPGDADDLEIEFFDKEELWSTPTGQIRTFKPASETLFTLNNQYTQTILADLQKEKVAYADYIKGLREKVIEKTGYQQPEKCRESVFSGRIVRDDYTIEKYLVKVSGDDYVPLLRLTPSVPPATSLEPVLLLDEKGKSHAVNEGFAVQLVRQGYEVIVPDLTGIGELGGGYKGGDALIQGVSLNSWYAGILTNKTPLAIRVEEVNCILDFMEQLHPNGLSPDNRRKVTGLACGTLTSDLLHAALLDKRLDKIALISPLFAYQSLVEEKEYQTKFILSAVPGAIATYDLPDLVSALAPGKVLMVNPVNALDKEVAKDVFEKMYREANTYLSGGGNTSSLQVKMQDVQPFQTLLSWIK